MTDNKKVFELLEMVSETIVVMATALWITRWEWIHIVYAVGVIFLFLSRMILRPDTNDITLHRLYGIRRIGSAILIFSAALTFVSSTTYIGYNIYLFPSSWLFFFVLFGVLEVYTTIRILHITKEK